MDRVFEKSRPPSPNSTKLKRMLLGKQKKPPHTQPQYFPYGGGGDQVDDLASQFDSYEPEELMVESHVPLEESSLHVLKRNARKILVSGSRYDVPEQLVPPNSRNSSRDPSRRISMPEPPEPPAPGLEQGVPALARFDPSAFALPSLPSLPTSTAQAVDRVREVARKTVVLRPLDSLADMWTDSGTAYAVAAVELWLLMLVVAVAAHAVLLVCTPAVWLLKVCLYVVK